MNPSERNLVIKALIMQSGHGADTASPWGVGDSHFDALANALDAQPPTEAGLRAAIGQVRDDKISSIPKAEVLVFLLDGYTPGADLSVHLASKTKPMSKDFATLVAKASARQMGHSQGSPVEWKVGSDLENLIDYLQKHPPTKYGIITAIKNIDVTDLPGHNIGFQDFIDSLELTNITNSQLESHIKKLEEGMTITQAFLLYQTIVHQQGGTPSTDINDHLIQEPLKNLQAYSFTNKGLNLYINRNDHSQTTKGDLRKALNIDGIADNQLPTHLQKRLNGMTDTQATQLIDVLIIQSGKKGVLPDGKDALWNTLRQQLRAIPHTKEDIERDATRILSANANFGLTEAQVKSFLALDQVTNTNLDKHLTDQCTLMTKAQAVKAVNVLLRTIGRKLKDDGSLKPLDPAPADEKALSNFCTRLITLLEDKKPYTPQGLQTVFSDNEKLLSQAFLIPENQIPKAFQAFTPKKISEILQLKSDSAKANLNQHLTEKAKGMTDDQAWLIVSTVITEHLKRNPHSNIPTDKNEWKDDIAHLKNFPFTEDRIQYAFKIKDTDLFYESADDDDDFDYNAAKNYLTAANLFTYVTTVAEEAKQSPEDKIATASPNNLKLLDEQQLAKERKESFLKKISLQPELRDLKTSFFSNKFQYSEAQQRALNELIAADKKEEKEANQDILMRKKLHELFKTNYDIITTSGYGQPDAKMHVEQAKENVTSLLTQLNNADSRPNKIIGKTVEGQQWLMQLKNSLKILEGVQFSTDKEIYFSQEKFTDDEEKSFYKTTSTDLDNWKARISNSRQINSIEADAGLAVLNAGDTSKNKRYSAHVMDKKHIPSQDETYKFYPPSGNAKKEEGVSYEHKKGNSYKYTVLDLEEKFSQKFLLKEFIKSRPKELKWDAATMDARINALPQKLSKEEVMNFLSDANTSWLSTNSYFADEFFKFVYQSSTDLDENGKNRFPKEGIFKQAARDLNIMLQNKQFPIIVTAPGGEPNSSHKAYFQALHCLIVNAGLIRDNKVIFSVDPKLESTEYQRNMADDLGITLQTAGKGDMASILKETKQSIADIEVKAVQDHANVSDSEEKAEDRAIDKFISRPTIRRL